MIGPHSHVEREHPRAAECPICGWRNDTLSESLRDEWQPQPCDKCRAPIIVRGRASGCHPREDYEVQCRVDLDALIFGMTAKQVETVRKLPRCANEALTPGELGLGASLHELGDLWRDKRGTECPIMIATNERRDSDGRREWWLTDLGCALQDHLAGLPGTRIPAHQIVGYRSGSDRNEEGALTHTYAMMGDDGLWPMCGYGWNRSGGTCFSIFRGSPGTVGDCKRCAANIAAGRPPVMNGFPHKTSWV